MPQERTLERCRRIGRATPLDVMTAGRGDCKGIHERTVIDESIGTPPRDARFVRFQNFR